MKAIIWNDDVPMGASFDVVDIPDEPAANGEGSLIDQAKQYHEE